MYRNVQGWEVLLCSETKMLGSSAVGQCSGYMEHEAVFLCGQYYIPVLTMDKSLSLSSLVPIGTDQCLGTSLIYEMLHLMEC